MSYNWTPRKSQTKHMQGNALLFAPKVSGAHDSNSYIDCDLFGWWYQFQYYSTESMQFNILWMINRNL